MTNISNESRDKEKDDNDDDDDYDDDDYMKLVFASCSLLSSEDSEPRFCKFSSFLQKINR